MKLLPEDKLIWSPIVVNSRMNRERNASGVNSYEKEFKFSPEKFLHSKLEEKGQATWIDLCCGSGNALIQTAQYFTRLGLTNQIKLEGVDLIDTFLAQKEELLCLQLIQGSLASWNPVLKYDLITCVHGLHYLGDKLDILSKSINALAADGVFIANFDPVNIRIDGQPGAMYLKPLFKTNNIEYNARQKIIKKTGVASVNFNLKYLGADDEHGPNYTGQDSVLSYYSSTLH